MHLYHKGDTRKPSESTSESNQNTMYWTFIMKQVFKKWHLLLLVHLETSTEIYNEATILFLSLNHISRNGVHITEPPQANTTIELHLTQHVIGMRNSSLLQ